MDELASHSSDQTIALRQFLIPGWLDAVLYVLVGGVVLTIVNWHSIWAQNSSGALPPNALQQLFTERFSSIGGFLGLPIFGKISLLLFWAFIGCLAYMLLWLLQYSLAVIHEDLAETTYIHPGAFSEGGYWRSVIAHNIFLICAVFVSIAYVAAAFKILLPMLSRVFQVGLFDVPKIGGWIELVISILLAGFLIYIAVILWRVLRGVWGLNKVPED